MSIGMEDIIETAEAWSPTERVVAQIWNEALKSSAPLKPSDNFFELGGDSVGLIVVLFNIQERLSIVLPPESIYMAANLRELAAFVDAALSC